MKIYDELVWRGLIKDVSSPEIEEKLNNGGLTFYIGTDPTGDSLHIGHFSSFLISKRLKDAGHNPILLVGGATGLIGDPKPDTERPMITKEQVQHNFDCLKAQAQKIFGFEVVNNYDWSKDLNFIDFLRDYGKYFNVNYMLNKDIVKRRLDLGITYTEFSYMIMQAMDFYWLHENKNCQLQVAGQDQWGNITAGIELIRKKTGKEAYGFTMPLLTKSDGTKFGKTEGGAIWLDAKKTTPYAFYQFWINTPDNDVIRELKQFTFLSKEEIEKIEESFNQKPHLRVAQKALAKEMTIMIHSKESYEQAVKLSEALFSGEITNLSKEEIEMVFSELPKIEISEDIALVDALVNLKAASSKREARDFINGGAVLVNGHQEKDVTYMVKKQDAIGKTYTVLRRGKKNYYLIEHK